MFLGHFGVAFAAKPAAPNVSLGMLFVAAQFADLLWPLLVLAGIEKVEVRPGITAVAPLDFVHYPYSHSLVALIAWGVAVALGYRILRDGGWRAPIVLGALVVSHWFLDVLVHRPDMPLALGDSPRLGLDIWNSVPLTLAIELLSFGVGVAIFARVTRPVDRIGTWALVAIVAFLLTIYAGSVFGPPPPSPEAIAIGDIGMVLLVAWAYWIDKHRTRA